MVRESRHQVLHGERVLSVLGVLLVLAGTVSAGVLDVRGARLAVLQCVVGNIRDELLRGHRDEAHYLGVHCAEASLQI